MKTIFLTAVLASVLVGCATTIDQTPPGPIEFRRGYADGCDSGLRGAGHPYVAAKRDWSLYSTSQTYKIGWDEGRRDCFERYNRL